MLHAIRTYCKICLQCVVFIRRSVCCGAMVGVKLVPFISVVFSQGMPASVQEDI